MFAIDDCALEISVIFNCFLDKFEYSTYFLDVKTNFRGWFSITLRSMDKYLDDFRMNMKYYREKAGISQVKLSVLCACGTGTIGGIEAGKAKPSFDMMVKIADALKVNPADLFIRDSSKSRSKIKEALREDFNFILSKI